MKTVKTSVLRDDAALGVRLAPVSWGVRCVATKRTIDSDNRFVYLIVFINHIVESY